MKKFSGIIWVLVAILVLTAAYTFYSKNKTCFENDFMTGTPDVIANDLIIDVKNPYDFMTFPLFDTEIENKDYVYQLQGYMKLTGKHKSKLIYTLTNLPYDLIEMELNKLGLDFTEENAKMFEYDDIDIKYRIKSFDLEYDQSIIDKIESQVIKCRK